MSNALVDFIAEYIAKKAFEAISEEVDSYNDGCIISSRWLTSNMVIAKIKRLEKVGASSCYGNIFIV